MPVTIPFSFATRTGNVPASNLDADFQALAAFAATQESQIAVLQSAMAAVSGPWTNVKSFGAVGDGVANDTAAIAAAIVSATTTGSTRVLYFPVGTYLTDAQTITSVASFRVTSAPGATLKVRTPASQYRLLVFITCSDITVEELTLDGNGSAPDANHHGLVTAVSSSAVTVRRCTIRNTGAMGVLFQSTGVPVAVDNVVVDCGQGIYSITGAQDIYGAVFARNTLFDIAGGFGGPAPAQCLGLNSNAPNSHIGARIEGNFITTLGAVMGIVVDPAGSVTNTGGLQTVITGNTIINGSGLLWGISAIGKDLAITGNVVRGAGDWGIEVFGQNLTIDGNVIDGQGGTLQGIFCGSFDNTQDLIISNNVITDGGPASRGIYLYLSTGSPIGQISVIGNKVRGYTTLLAAWETTGVLIQGNWFRDPLTASGIYIHIMNTSVAPDNVGTLIGGNRFSGIITNLAGILVDASGVASIDSLFVTGNATSGMVTSAGGVSVPAPGNIDNILVTGNHGVDPTNPLKNFIYP